MQVMTTQRQLAAHAARLAELPFVESVDFENVASKKGREAKWRAKLSTPRGRYNLAVEVRRTALSYSLVDRTLSTVRSRPDARGGWILLATHVSPEMGRYLGERDANFIDEAGNCRLRLDEGYVALVEGRKPPRRRVAQAGIRAPGYQVLFALLAKPELLQAPVRDVAAAAGVGKSTAATMMRRLREERLVAGRRLLRPGDLLDRWLVAYRDLVRPHLYVGSYQAPDTGPEELEARLEEIFEREGLAGVWGGGAALHRLFGQYRGTATILHLDEVPPELPRILRVLPSPDGPLTVLRLPGPIGAEGRLPRTAHPLLVYTELTTGHDERAREVAEQFRIDVLGGIG